MLAQMELIYTVVEKWKMCLLQHSRLWVDYMTMTTQACWSLALGLRRYQRSAMLNEYHFHQNWWSSLVVSLYYQTEWSELTRPKGHKTSFILNSAEHEILIANK